MSYIKTVGVVNLKGTSGTFSLGPVTYIYGPNRSNKSTVIDAIDIALLGYHPKPNVPRTNDGVMRFASRQSMSAFVQFADGRTVQRNYSSDGKSVKCETDPKGFKVDPRLAICLDHALYFGQSEAERVQQVMNLSEGLGAADRVPAFIARLKMIRLDDHTEVVEQVLTSILKEVPKFTEGQPVQPWLAQVLEWAKTEYKNANSAAKSFEGTNKTLTEANAIDTLDNIDEIDQLRAKAKELNAQRDQLHQEWGRQVENVKTIERQIAAKARLVAQLTAAQQDAYSDGTREKTEALKKECEESITAAEAERQQHVESRKRVMDKISELNKEIEKFHSESAIKIQELSELSVKRNQIGDAHYVNATLDDTIQSKMYQIEAIDREVIELKTKIVSFDAMTCCPTCKTERGGWQAEAKAAYQNLVDKHHDVKKSLQKQIFDLSVQRETESGKFYKNLKEQLAETTESWERLKIKAHELNVKQVELQKQVKDAQPTIANFDQRELECSARIKGSQTMLNLLTAAAEKAKFAEAKVADLQSQIAKLDVPSSVPVVAEPPSLAQVNAQIAEISGRIRAHDAQAAERKRIAQVKEQYAGMKARVELIKRIGIEVKEEQAKIVADAFGPVLEVANELMIGVIESSLVYQDGMVGCMDPEGRFISASTFSGSEERVTFAAIAAGLARLAGDKIAVIDEMGTIDRQTRAAVVLNALRVVEKQLLDQVILIGTEINETLPSGITLIQT